MDENNSQPIGEAQPIAPNRGWKILKRIGTVAGVTLGGLAFASLLVPTRLQGANRSARLQWQTREAEITQTIHNEDSAQSNALPALKSEQQPEAR